MPYDQMMPAKFSKVRLAKESKSRPGLGTRLWGPERLQHLEHSHRRRWEEGVWEQARRTSIAMMMKP